MYACHAATVAVLFTLSASACSGWKAPSTDRQGDGGSDPGTGGQSEDPPDPPPGSSTDTGTAAADGFYVDPASNSANWVKDHSDDTRATAIQSNIASKAAAHWFGNWDSNISTDVSNYVGAAATANKWPILVAYNIPGRDCGGASSGGAGSPDAFRTWIASFATAIGTRRAIVIIEPDSLAQLDCLPSDADRQTRLDLVRYATEQFRDKAPNARAYVDGGNAQWIAAATMAQRLDSGGVHNVRGFAVNVSNFYTTAESTTYSNDVRAALSQQFGYTAPFVIDTSRNGKGASGGSDSWCNPAGRKLGTPSQFEGGADALLWVKAAGDSDGPCGTAPNTPAGTFSPDLAINLINGT